MKTRSKRLRLSKLLLRIGKIAEQKGAEAFLVGGAVRDALAGKKNYDLDIMTIGSPEKLVRAVAKLLKGRVASYPRFGTFSVETSKGFRIDFATARKETYPHPGALPKVAFSGLESDIMRRDFTVNALALRLSGKGRGQITDYYGGQRDLKNGVLRILHVKSFRDDPTRIFRLARFASRGFKIDRLTGKAASFGVKFIARVSPERRARELMLVLEEKDPYTALLALTELGATEIVLPGIDISDRLSGLSGEKTLKDRLALLLRATDKAARRGIYSRLRFSRKLQNEVEGCFVPKAPKAPLNGFDLIKMGYKQGPVFKRILGRLIKKKITSRREAKRFVFDNFPQKI